MKIDELYSDVRLAMGAMGTREFENAFLGSLKYVIQDLNSKLDLEIEVPEEVTSAEIGFPWYCDRVFFPGMKFYMQRSGQWAGEPDTESFQFYQQQLRATVGPAIQESTDFATR
jgi:hypothetical protein